VITIACRHYINTLVIVEVVVVLVVAEVAAAAAAVVILVAVVLVAVVVVLMFCFILYTILCSTSRAVAMSVTADLPTAFRTHNMAV
jgi:hypothetical protein